MTFTVFAKDHKNQHLGDALLVTPEHLATAIDALVEHWEAVQAGVFAHCEVYHDAVRDFREYKPLVWAPGQPVIAEQERLTTIVRDAWNGYASARAFEKLEVETAVYHEFMTLWLMADQPGVSPEHLLKAILDVYRAMSVWACPQRDCTNALREAALGMLDLLRIEMELRKAGIDPQAFRIFRSTEAE